MIRLLYFLIYLLTLNASEYDSSIQVLKIEGDGSVLETGTIANRNQDFSVVFNTKFTIIP